MTDQCPHKRTRTIYHTDSSNYKMKWVVIEGKKLCLDCGKIVEVKEVESE